MDVFILVYIYRLFEKKCINLVVETEVETAYSLFEALLNFPQAALLGKQF